MRSKLALENFEKVYGQTGGIDEVVMHIGNVIGKEIRETQEEVDSIDMIIDDLYKEKRQKDAIYFSHTSRELTEQGKIMKQRLERKFGKNPQPSTIKSIFAKNKKYTKRIS